MHTDLDMSANNTLDLSEAYGGEWTDSPPPIWERLVNSAKKHSDKLALACLHQSATLYELESLSNSHLQWSYSQLIAATDSFAAGLQARGISSGAPIVTILDNGVEFIITFWAAHKLRCPFVPLNPRNLSNAVEARHMLSVAGAAVVVVGDRRSAASFDALEYRSERELIKISAEPLLQSQWNDFANFLAADGGMEVSPVAACKLSPANPKDSPQMTNEAVAILFTSGTTSLPKGCPHTDLTLNAFMENLALGACSSDDIFCGVLPNNHAMGYFYVLHFFCEGGTVIYPSAPFHSERMAQAIEMHSCSHTCLVPTALHSLLDHAERAGVKFPSLRDVCLAGASITAQHIRQAVHSLGSQAVSTGFGMTEGSPIWAAATTDTETLVSGNDTISGKASPGARIKICSPESTLPLPRGQSGEIHESGPGVIAGYLGSELKDDCFYVDDDNRTWFKTGDRAIMYVDGSVSVVGRYKDMIIRGGENIAPAAIESIMNQVPGVEAQVVAATDSIAGEVPVAIVRSISDNQDRSGLLKDAVRTSLGTLYVPDEIVTLQSLGLDDYPRTMSGKVQKLTLRNLVQAFRQHHSSSTHGHNAVTPDIIKTRSVDESVLRVWWQATGISSTNLDLKAPTSNFADSLTIMRVRDMYRKELGVTLSAQEMSENANLQDQIKALTQKSYHPGEDSGHQLQIYSPPPDLDDLQVILGPDNDAAAFMRAARTTLANSGFDYDHDVDTVIQSSDFTNVMISAKVMDTWNFGIAIVADDTTTAALRHALIFALKQSPLWPSFYVLGYDGSPFYITMKPQQKLYEYCLTDGGSVDTLADLQHVAIRYPHPEHATYPGLLFHARIYHIKELNSAAFVMYLHHSVHDASSMRLVLEDINKTLRDPDQALRPHAPFKMWIDIYHSLRDSPRATIEVDWHVKRLGNIHLHRKALYPPSNVPRQATTSDPDGIDYGFDVPELLNLKHHHPHITASVIFKAAMALVNVTRTQHTHALFSNFEAARSSLPFWPMTFRHIPAVDGTTLADLDASDIAGPTMNAVTNLIAIHPDETALAFLSRLQAEQAELTKRAHAPWRRIISKLNALHPGENAGEMLHQTHQTQFLTWVPGFLGEYERLRVVKIAIRAALGLCFVAGLGGPRATTYMVSLRWDVANFSQGAVEAFVGDVERAVRWLLEEGNWDRGVGGFLGLFSA